MFNSPYMSSALSGMPPGQPTQPGPPTMFPGGGQPGMPSGQPTQPGMPMMFPGSSQPGMPPGHSTQSGPPMMFPGSSLPGMPPGHSTQPGPPMMFPGGGQPGMPPGQPTQPGPPTMFPGGGQPGMPPGEPAQPGRPVMFTGSGQPGIPPGQSMQPGPPTMFPGGGQPGMPPMPPGGIGTPAPMRQKLDPEAMPSVVQVIEDDKQTRSGLFPTGYPTAELPPLVTTNFFAQDQGNCNPKFIRSTLYAIPQTQEIAKMSCLPVSMSVTPFAELDERELIPPVVDLGELGPVRCQRCKAYMCPFMEFVDGGRKFRCPFCKVVTPEDAYFAHLDHTGRRTDISYRPELCLGSYEFIATKEYCKNGIKPREPAFIFMLDVSYNAVRHGLVELFCRNVVELLRNLPKDYGADRSTMKIGLATYDNVIHFYKLGGDCRPSMLVVNDVSDVFAPLADDFLVGFDQAEGALITCLREIVHNFAETRITETILGPVIQAGLDALKNSDRAGKLFIFHTSLPTLECPGQLKNREDRQVLGTDKEKTVLSPANDFYQKLGEKCVKHGCCVDLFLFPNSFVDVASLIPVTQFSGGSIYKYQYFDQANDGKRFLSDLRRSISRQIAFDIMIRIRTSTGIRPTGFYGSFYMQNTTDMELSAIDSDKAVQVEMKYDDKLDEKESAYIQVAVLFTSCGGQRRLRIHNISLPISANQHNIFRFADEGAVIAHLFKSAEKQLREQSPKEIREQLVAQSARILAAYRKYCNESSPITQLVLPECLKLLPVHINCAIKNDALNGGSELTVDDRAWMMSLVPSMTVPELLRFLYPRIFCISSFAKNVSGENGVPPSQENGNSAVCADGLCSDIASLVQVRASIDFLRPDETFLIDNGLVAFIWIGQSVSADWLRDIFNVNAFQHLDVEKHDIPVNDNPRSRTLQQLLVNLNAGRPRSAKLFVIKQHDGLESWMKKFLVEDRYAANSNTYVDFLCHLHREIRAILA